MTLRRDSLYIGGQWVPASGTQTIEVINATSEEALGTIPDGVHEDVDRAVGAARLAFDDSDWATSDGNDRAAAMHRLADAMEKRGPDIARTVTQQNGMPITLSEQMEGMFAAAIIRYYAELARQVVDERRPSPMGFDTVIQHSPVGVVGAITPWNFPQVLGAMKIGPALAAGCTMVIKPAPGTTLDSYLLAEAADEAELPPGVLNWVAGERDLGAYLVSHPDVDKVAFTGSTTAGRAIGEVCGRLLRPVTLELGGKSAAIILDDADLDTMLEGLFFASLANNGQTCIVCSRILAPENRYDEIVEAVAEFARTKRVGDPLDPRTEVGPLASAAQRERVEQFIEGAKADFRLVAGGSRPKALDRGWFVEPTVFADVDNSAKIAQEEIFGPVLSVIKYRDEKHAVEIANDSMYGLGGTVFTADVERGLAFAHRLQTGSTGINGFGFDVNAPFGGVKASGLGREMGPEGLVAYQQTKSIYLPPVG